MQKFVAARGRAKGRYTRKRTMLQQALSDKFAVEVIDTKWSEVNEAFSSLESLNEKILENVHRTRFQKF